MRSLLRERNPRIGWWIDNDPIRFYYGCDPYEVDYFSKIGIVAPWVGLSLEPVSLPNPAILVIELPTKWMMEQMDQRLQGHSEAQKSRLLVRDLYTKWTRFDHQYYTGLKIHIVKQVPARYIAGFMR